MQNKDKGDGIEDSPLDMLLVILLDGASKEVVMPSSLYVSIFSFLMISQISCSLAFQPWKISKTNRTLWIHIIWYLEPGCVDLL